MNQVHKRLKIIKLAIALTDEECINTQIYKLAAFANDNDPLAQIITLLQQKHFGQAGQAIDRFLSNKKESKEPSLFNATLPDAKVDTQSSYSSSVDTIVKQMEDIGHHLAQKDKTQQQDNPIAQHNRQEGTQESGEALAQPEGSDSLTLPHIDAKFEDYAKRYAPMEVSLEDIEPWALYLKIKETGYTSQDIVEGLEYYRYLSEEKQSTKAAALLLLLAATGDHDALFYFARALFRGKIVKEDKERAIELFETLALHESHPEAMCDLAQIYEHGMGVKKDLKRAKELYRESSELGSKRAMAHLERLDKKGLFGKLFG